MSAESGQALRTRLLLLVRGAIDWAQAGAGDPPLSASGTTDAELISASLPAFEAIVASPLRASYETAQALAVQRPVAVHAREDLDEIRTATSPAGPEAYGEWLDRVFESYTISSEGEPLADAAARLAG